MNPSGRKKHPVFRSRAVHPTPAQWKFGLQSNFKRLVLAAWVTRSGNGLKVKNSAKPMPIMSHGVEEAGDDEHLHLQHRDHFQLAPAPLQEFTAEQTETDRGSERARPNTHTSGNDRRTLHISNQTRKFIRHLLSFKK